MSKEEMEMNALVVFGSRYGNTRRIAEAIAEGLKDECVVDVRAIEHTTPDDVRSADVVVVGGPTEIHGMTPALGAWVDGVAYVLNGKPAVAFDTRLDMARLISGSAAKGIAAHLRRAGGKIVMEDASFFVKGKPAALEAGELARAVAWGREIAAKVTGQRSGRRAELVTR